MGRGRTVARKITAGAAAVYLRRDYGRLSRSRGLRRRSAFGEQTHCWGQHQYRRVHRGGGVLRGWSGALPVGKMLKQDIEGVDGATEGAVLTAEIITLIKAHFPIPTPPCRSCKKTTPARVKPADLTTAMTLHATIAGVTGATTGTQLTEAAHHPDQSPLPQSQHHGARCAAGCSAGAATVQRSAAVYHL